MPGNPLLVATVALAIINGMFSPFLVVTTTRIILPVFAPALLMTSATLIVFFGYLLGATATLILAGVPAALFERATGRAETDAASYAIWLVSAAVLTFPALLRAASLAL